MKKQKLELFTATLSMCFILFMLPIGRVITLVDALLHAFTSMMPLLVLIVAVSIKGDVSGNL